MLSHTLTAFCLLASTTAHFILKYPTSRGFDDDKEGTAACGSFDTVSSQRTNFSISGSPITVQLGHPQTNMAVYMALGANPGAFSLVAKQQFMINGLGLFCFNVTAPSGMNISDGAPATIQVVTGNEDGGGLYQCADVTLSTAQLSQDDFNKNCQNAGPKISQENIPGNPNTTAKANTGKNDAVAQPRLTPWALGVVGLTSILML